jgi:opacity protein-like surface antigen
MRKLSIVLLSVLLVTEALPQTMTKTGTTAAQFLKIGVGPRSIGMGGAYTAISNDASAMFWNPGGLSRMQSGEASFTHVEWLAGVKFEYASVALDLRDFGAVGANVSVLSMDQMMVRTVEDPEGTGEYFGAGGLSIGLSYARNLTDRFSIGFNAKYVREYIWHESSYGFAIDVGTLYITPFLNGLRIGASMSNFGPKMQMQGRDATVIYRSGAAEGNVLNADLQLEYYELPLVFRVGLATEVFKNSDMRLTTAIDAVHPNDNTEYVNGGLEFAWNEMLFFRGGYKSLFQRGGEEGLTAGVGVNYRVAGEIQVKVDYAYQDFGRLKNVQYISMGVRF